MSDDSTGDERAASKLVGHHTESSEQVAVKQPVVRLLLVDGLNLIRRVYAAVPTEDEKEKAQGALHSSLQSLQRSIRDTDPTHVICVIDGDSDTWRHHLYPSYKEGRSPMPTALKEVMPQCEEIFAANGVKTLCFDDLEADDVIATLAAKTAERGGQAIVLSTDHAFLQLVSPLIQIRDHFKRAYLDSDYIEAKYHVPVSQLIEFWGLSGNTTNHIPGIPKVGAKTAVKLLNEYGDANGIKANSDEIKGKLGESLRESWHLFELSQQLVALKLDCQLGINLNEYRYTAN